MDVSFRLLYEVPGLPVHVVIPAPQFMGTKQQLIDLSIPANTPYAEVHASQVPGDLYFRNAWELKDKKIAINLEKAKGIHIDNLRVTRESLLNKLDLQMNIAIEKNDLLAQANISTQKQKLRDMPKDQIFNTAVNADQLKDILPDYMKE